MAITVHNLHGNVSIHYYIHYYILSRLEWQETIHAESVEGQKEIYYHLARIGEHSSFEGNVCINFLDAIYILDKIISYLCMYVCVY